MLGGLNAVGEELDSAIAYNIATKEVRHLANLPCARKGAAAFILHAGTCQILHIMGGSNQGTIINDYHMYRPSTDE